MQHNRTRPAVATPRQGGPKPVMTMVHLPYYRVKQRHLEDYLAKVYRMGDFDFSMAAGITPGVCPEYRVTPVLPPAPNAQKDADRIRSGRHSGNVSLILNVLCLDGYIPAGRYTIDTHAEPPASEVYRSLLMKTEDPAHADCVAFRRTHCQDKLFTRQVALMDSAVLEQKAKP